MIDYISGKVTELSPTELVIENNGIGYLVQISIQTYEQLRGKGEARVFVHQHVRQDNPEEFYGFFSKDERELFKIIIGVSGIGVASARMILSSMSSEELRAAILSEDVNKIKSVKGIGLKSAQRLILELKDKVRAGEDGEDSAAYTFAAPVGEERIPEAMAALTALGYSAAEIEPVLRRAGHCSTAEETIRFALREFAGGK